MVRCFIVYDIRAATDSNKATVFEAMGDYEDRKIVLRELQREALVDVYGPFAVCSYKQERKDDKEFLIDEHLEFLDSGDGRGILDVPNNCYYCSSQTSGPRKFSRPRSRDDK